MTIDHEGMVIKVCLNLLPVGVKFVVGAAKIKFTKNNG